MTKLRSKNVDGVPVICEECGVALTKESTEDAQGVSYRHDDNMHNGDDTSVVVDGEYNVDTEKVPKAHKDGFIKTIFEMVGDSS